jgi:hypothetical protein
MLAAALDGAVGLCTLLVFFCLLYPNVSLNWWGNVGAFNTDDVNGVPIWTPESGTFGPSTWT